MELTDDQKKRILEEEQQRLAEERYRAQIRRELEGGAVTPKAPAPVRFKIGKTVLVLVVILIGAAAWEFSRRAARSAPSAPAATATSERAAKPSPVALPKLTTAQ